jgi:chloramphenicol 3-O phosphotransferase
MAPTISPVMTNVVVLNGGSSSGKTSLARSLQAILSEPWLRFGVDMLIDAMPDSMTSGGAGIGFADDGGVSVGSSFRDVESAWMEGVASMARAGVRIIIDDVFLGGRASQERWRASLAGLSVLWVGVHCEPGIATAREASRKDRTAGMAVSQAEIVHAGVLYDIEVDTSHRTALESARIVANHVRSRGSQPGIERTD